MDQSSLTQPSVFWRFAGYVTLFLTTCLLGAEPKPAPATEAPKEYFVFTGADVMTEYGGKPYRVVGAKGSSLVIKAGAETEDVPARRVNGYRAMRGTKLSRFKANLDALRAESLHIALDRQNAEFDLGAASALSNEERSLQNEKASLQIGQMALGASAAKTGEREQHIEEASKRIEDTRDLMNDYAAKRPDEQERSAERQLAAAKAAAGRRTSLPDLPFAYRNDPAADGFELKCAVSSPHPLENAYLAVTLAYVDRHEPRKIQTRTSLQALSRVTEKPRKVTLTLRGMPLGFHLVGCQIGLYGNGQEVATNVSQTQEAMTAEQVHQYFLGDYLLSNRDKTLPPAPLLLAPADELRPQVSPAALEQVIYARLDEHGNVVALSTDETEVRDVPPPILAVLRHVRFFPGLENGKPVDSRVKLKTSDLLR